MNCYRFLPLLLLLSGCPFANEAASPVKLPTEKKVDALVVSPNFGEDRTERRIVERAKIDRFVKFINERDSNWKKPWNTFPSGAYTVLAEQHGKTVAVFWPAPDHIGGRSGGEDCHDNRLRRLTAKEWKELTLILEVHEKPPWPN